MLNDRFSRRDLLKASGTAAGLAVAGPLLAACASTGAPTETNAPSASAKSSGSKPSLIVVQDAGGSYGAANKAAIYDPFTKETGVAVATVQQTVAQFMAQAEAGQVELSCIDTSQTPIINMWNKGFLTPLDYSIIGSSFNLDDVPESLRPEYMMGKIYWASVMAYRTDVFSAENHPKSWAEFWDATTFPGPRAMQNNKTDRPELEFAELAAGTSLDSLYPIDVQGALDSMSKVRPNIVKFWGSGAESAQLLDQKEAVLMSIWNGRAQTLIDGGRPVAIEWNGARRQINSYCVPKGSPYPEWGMRLIDFALRPEVQAALAEQISYGPVNKSAAALMSDEARAKSASNPEWVDQGFDMNVQWWIDNLESATNAWTEWYQQG